MNNIYLISKKYKYIIHTFPKSGCTTLRLLHLYLNFNNDNNLSNSDFEDKHHLLLNSKLPDNYNNYFNILVYRNSLERICSIFYQKVTGISSNNITFQGKIINQPYGLNNNLNTFNKWLDVLFKNNSYLNSDIHFKPQQKNTLIKYDQILELNSINMIFKDHDNNLNKLSIKILKNINNKNSLNKYDADILKVIDLPNYDFYKDEKKLLKKYYIPSYKYLLTTDIIKKIKQNYKDDFLN